MRATFVNALCELAAGDERLFLLTADLGWSVLEPFARAYPDRFLNVGVAEQNMLGVATGLAREGYVPFAYSIATFATMRCFEQMRDGPILHQLPVRVIGMGGGFSYGHAGPTHYALEDLPLGRSQPGLTVIAPADNAQTREVMTQLDQIEGPVYLRLEKSDCPDLPGMQGRFQLGVPEIVKPGHDLLLLATGAIAREALRAAVLLEQHGHSAAVAVLAHLGFSASPALRRFLAGYPRVITVEEGYVAGGLGSLVAEAIAEEGLACRLVSAGVTVPSLNVTGGAQYMRQQHGIDAAGLVNLADRLFVRRMVA
jgi:transketolase